MNQKSSPSGIPDSVTSESALALRQHAGLVLFLGLFLAADPALYKRGFLRLIPPRARHGFSNALGEAGCALERWLLGQLMAMICVGVLIGVGLWMLGIPLALSLAILAGLLDFVPYIGLIAAALPAVLLGFMQSPTQALYDALLYAFVQQIEGNFVVPLAQRWAVSLPPALGILSVVVFGLLFGFPSLLFATPLMVAMMLLVRKLYVEDVLQQEG